VNIDSVFQQLFYDPGSQVAAATRNQYRFGFVDNTHDVSLFIGPSIV
jgi:hypothetical protein